MKCGRFSQARMLIVLVAVGGAATSRADLSIYDIQYTTDPSGISPCVGTAVNLVGGVVTHSWFGGKPRVYLQDPACPAWGGIMIKDFSTGAGFASAVAVGDYVRLTDVYVEESGGNTVLDFGGANAPNAAFTVQGSGTAPAPILVDAGDLAAPPNVNHAASEPYESMILTFEDVSVGNRDLGKKGDNYELIEGTDIAWGTDYQNIDAGGPYHPAITTGAHLESITGVVEQNLGSGWDYYQLCTRCDADIVPEPGAALLLAAAVLGVTRRRRS